MRVIHSLPEDFALIRCVEAVKICDAQAKQEMKTYSRKR